MNISDIDKDILFFFNRTIRSDISDHIFVFFSDRTSIIYLIPFIVYIFFRIWKKKEERKKLITVLILAGAAAGVSDLITSRIFKPFFERPRPCQTLPDLYFWKSKAGEWLLTDGLRSFKSSYSFVSSHASNSMTAAVVLSYYYRRYFYVFIFSSLIIGISRMYLGVHYPSDVLGGWLTGALIAVMIRNIHLYIMKKYPKVRI